MSDVRPIIKVPNVATTVVMAAADIPASASSPDENKVIPTPARAIAPLIANNATENPNIGTIDGAIANEAIPTAIITAAIAPNPLSIVDHFIDPNVAIGTNRAVNAADNTNIPAPARMDVDIRLDVAAIIAKAPAIANKPLTNLPVSILPNICSGATRAISPIAISMIPPPDKNAVAPLVRIENPATAANIAVITPRPFQIASPSMFDILSIADTIRCIEPARANSCNEVAPIGALPNLDIATIAPVNVAIIPSIVNRPLVMSAGFNVAISSSALDIIRSAPARAIICSDDAPICTLPYLDISVNAPAKPPRRTTTAIAPLASSSMSNPDNIFKAPATAIIPIPRATICIADLNPVPVILYLSMIAIAPTTAIIEPTTAVKLVDISLPSIVDSSSRAPVNTPIDMAMVSR